MRQRAGRGRDDAAPGALSLRLPFRKPFAAEGLFGHLAASAVPGVEEFRDGAYRRTLRLPNGNGIASLTPTPDYVRCRLILDDVRDLSTAIARCRRLLDLDADPEAVDDELGADAISPRSSPRRRGSGSAHRRRAGARGARRARPAGVDSGRRARTPVVSSRAYGGRSPTSAVSRICSRRSTTSPRSIRHTWIPGARQRSLTR